MFNLEIIRIEDVSKVFGPYNQTVKTLEEEGKSKEEIFRETGATIAVNKANISIEEGEIFVVMGLSGSGKSTLIRLINRLIEPTNGNIFIENQNITELDKKGLREFRRKHTSMVFQSFALFPFKTLLENTAFGLEIKNVDKKERFEKSKKALELVGLGSYIHQLPKQLSGGMQQRVGLARALANDTNILLMDEAFSALDPLIRKEMQDELLQLQQRMHKTIVFITHDLDEALHLGDRIALMNDGIIAQIGTPQEIITNPADDYVENFVKGIDRSKVLKVKHVMDKVESTPLQNEETVKPEQILNEIFNKFTSGSETLSVIDENYQIIGKLNFKQVFKILEVEGEVNKNV